jgi:hypothetical protein
MLRDPMLLPDAEDLVLQKNHPLTDVNLKTI